MPEITKPNDSDMYRLLHSSFELRLKRVIDYVLSLAVLCLIWPILVVVALCIKATSPGPVFYRGVRSGKNPTLFRILKFRTMVDNAENLGGPTTGTNDHRVTNVGRFLRHRKIDELPQFFNVLIGDMSLVGPRPEVPEYTKQYRGEECLILSMRPGITDNSSLEFINLDDIVGTKDPDAYFKRYILPRKNFLRLKYVKEWSLVNDMRILFKTFCHVFTK